LGLTKAHGLLNADLSWNSVYGRPFDISVFGSNLLNKTFVVTPVENWQPGFFGGLAFYNEPRMYGARLTYHFGEGR
jgi:iron complex outermembrane receptor protein